MSASRKSEFDVNVCLLALCLTGCVRMMSLFILGCFSYLLYVCDRLNLNKYGYEKT